MPVHSCAYPNHTGSCHHGPRLCLLSTPWCSEEEAARAYDRALWRLKPKEAHSYVNFKDEASGKQIAGLTLVVEFVC